MTPDELERQIDRCDREIAEIEARTDEGPAYLRVLGTVDWEREKRLLVETGGC